MEYDDPMLRLRKVTAPNGHQTITDYGEGIDQDSRWVKVKSQIDSNYWSESKSFYDGLGRTYKTQKTDLSDPAGDIFTLTCFDNMGRVLKSSNPFRNVSNPTCSSSLEWTTPDYDDLSRTEKVTSPDATDVQITFGLSTSAPYGTTKTITDQAGKKRKGITDAMGSMVRVIEDPDSQNLTTDYVFDTLGNLRKTTQGDQIRYFNYDSLGRVLRAKQVEQDVNTALALSSADEITTNNSWTVKYTYDDNSNIETTTDARNNTITATYDRLNRITVRNYSDSTPDVGFYYDGRGIGGIPDDSNGKTTKVYSTVSESRNTSFDQMGRTLTSEQRTDGTTYPFIYTYNLSGAMIEETYPSGRVVKNTLNPDGELQQVQSKKNSSSGFWTYADAFSHNAAGAVTRMQLGNGLWETASYDDERLQVTQIGLGTTASTQNLLKLEFNYEGPSPSSTPDKNNGSMREQKITVPTVGGNAGFTATQTYTYDSLNRLQSATETVSSTQTWKQTFDYDRYGNRRFNTTGSNTTTLGSCSTAVCNPTFPTDSTNRNRFSSGQNYVYDAAGSVTQNSQGERFGYDAEDHQKEFFAANNSGSVPDATYLYDGEGRRVKKVAGSEVTVFVYDGSGMLVAEYATTAVPTQDAKVSYTTTDHLGSPRIVTDRDAKVLSRKDFTAFGETVTTSQRVSGINGNGYDAPTIRQDYTGYQKDNESGLEFAQARYYNTQHGRFTSVDPLTASAAIKNPQTFNRYSYVINSPYKFVDPLGLALQDIGVVQLSNGFEAGEAEQDARDLQQKTVKQQKQKPPSKKKAKTPKKPKSKPAAKPPTPAAPTTPTPPVAPGVSPSEKWVAEQFGSPGAYFSNPNDGDPIDQTLGYARNEASATKDPENHLYPSPTDPRASSGFYVPEGGRYVGETPYTEESGQEVRVVLLYFEKLGGLADVTVAVFHVINIDTSMPRDQDGRRKLGDLGPGAGGSWTYRAANGTAKSPQGIHAHLEIYRGKHTSLPSLGKKPHTNFNGVVP